MSEAPQQMFSIFIFLKFYLRPFLSPLTLWLMYDIQNNLLHSGSMLRRLCVYVLCGLCIAIEIILDFFIVCCPFFEGCSLLPSYSPHTTQLFKWKWAAVAAVQWGWCRWRAAHAWWISEVTAGLMMRPRLLSWH